MSRNDFESVDQGQHNDTVRIITPSPILGTFNLPPIVIASAYV